MNRGFVFDGCEVEVKSTRPSQSPWEFSGFSNSVKTEHANRNTTSLDHKISELRSRKKRKAAEKEQQDEAREKKKGSKAFNEDEFDDKEDEDETEDEEDVDSEEEEEEEEEVDEDDAGEVEDAVEGSLGEAEEDDEDDQDEDDEDDGDSDDDQEPEEAVVEGEQVQAVKKKVKPGAFFASSEGASFSAKSFGDLNLSRPLVRACEALGYKQPTPIQAACIPLALTGRDISGSAVTGSGKTAAFGLPILERLLYRPRRIPAIRVMILTPTRELAVQVHSMLEKLAQFTDIRCCLVVGGLSSKVQEAALRTRPDIVVATPGRMIDHLHNAQSVGIEELAILVLDEADRLLELGFTKEVHELVRMCPSRRQTMLFSATMTDEVDELVKLSLNFPVRLSADPKTQRPSTLTEEVVKIRPNVEADKEAVLLALCTRSFTSKVIIFSGTKIEAHRLKILFGLLGLKAAELHGNLTQAMRLDALEIFRKQEADFLLATDVAARGLDIVGVETVINYECPSNITTYVHRVGRTARAGNKGCAITFATERDRPLVKAVAKKSGSKLKNRILAQGAIAKWRQKIEELEVDIKTIMQEEREERVLRKAEMEANKAQNMMEHEDEIYSRPKRIWFQTEKEKRATTKPDAAGKEAGKGKKMISVEEAQENKEKEKRRIEREKNLSRKKRRRLEASREEVDEDQDDDDDDDEETGLPAGKKAKGKKGGGKSVVDLAYLSAKAAKGEARARAAGKLPPKRRESKKKEKAPKRKEEMEELFGSDMSAGKKGSRDREDKKPKRKPGVGKKAFKSKARFKRRK
ncbi:ATP-dependent RNA helicase DDX27 [Marchantia polymorpha subsp. ruderalis]